MKKLLVVVMVIGLAVNVFGAGAPEREDELPVLRVAMVPYLNSLPIQFAYDEGWDVEHGLKLDLEVYSLGPPMLEALAANRWDVGSIGSAGVYGVASYEAKVIGDTLLASGGLELFVRPDSDILSVRGHNPDFPEVYGNPETVEGSTIITSIGSFVHLGLLRWLEILGVSEDDVDIVHMDTVQTYQAFRAGRGDVIAFSPPLNYRAADEGWEVIATMSNMDYPIYDMLLANPRIYDEKKDLLVKFVELYYRAADYLTANPDLLVERQVQFQRENGLDSTEADVRDEIQNRTYVTSDLALARARDGRVGESVRNHALFEIEKGTIEADQIDKYGPHNLVSEIILEALGDS